MLRRGASGAAVAEVRARLAHLGLCADVPATATLDSVAFDDDLDRAVRAFQQERGITVDGIVGPDTFRRLDEARWQLGDRVLSYVPGHMMVGDDVTTLQRRLTELGFNSGRPDGIFGADTDHALREFQAGVGVVADGTCGPETFRAFDRLIRTVIGGNAAELREDMKLADLQTGVADKVIVIDPGSTVEPDICHAIAVRVEGRLAALGTQARSPVLRAGSTPVRRSAQSSRTLLGPISRSASTWIAPKVRPRTGSPLSTTGTRAAVCIPAQEKCLLNACSTS